MIAEQEKISLKALLPALLSFIAITLLLTVAVSAIGLERLREIIAGAGLLAPLLYIAVRALTFVAAPLNSGPLQFAAGILFGFVPGTLLSLIGEIIGGSLNFWIARKLGRPVVQRLAGADGMQRIDRFYHRVGEVWTLVYARLFFFAFYDFVSYAAGLTPLKYRQYLLVTAIAGILPTAAAVGIGTTITGDSSQLIFLYAALGVLCVIPLLFYPHIRRWFGTDKAQQNESSAI
ncbi:MAG: TVP38/TMEM64 family protein [Chloroflexi bacterium]|nr:TVP38/TMEM64 family protein [Chloroflexota bacterium]